MDEQLSALLATRGMVRRRELVKAGWSRKRLRRLLRRGELRLLAPDVFALPGPPAAGEDLTAGVVALDAVASGLTAALQHGWAVAQAPEPAVVTVGRNRSRAHRSGFDVRRRDLADTDVVERDGLRLTSPVRTVLDCCRELPLAQAVAVADSALRAGDVSHAELRAALVTLPAGRLRDRIARAVALADPASGSVLESLCRVLLAQAGLAPEATQLVIRTSAGGWIGRVDFAWPAARLVVEVDGFAFHADRAAYRQDRRRGNALQPAGWRVLRSSWEDVVGQPDTVVADVRDLLAGSASRCVAA
jgi:hypothetical protein